MTTSNVVGQLGLCNDENSAMAWCGAGSTKASLFEFVSSGRAMAVVILALSLAIACICTLLSK